MAAAAPPRSPDARSNARFLVVLAVGLAAICALTYAPALNNGFISDDFVYLSQVRMVAAGGTHLYQVPPGFSRLTGHLYFYLCYKFFGLSPVLYYLPGLCLHFLNCLLVYAFIHRVTGRRPVAAAAAVFFALYERHHEAVMWISAVHELLLCLFALSCLLFWHRWITAERRQARYAALAGACFVLTLLSKESAVVLVALMAAVELLVKPANGSFLRRAVKYLPFLAITIGYAVLVHATDPLITAGFYQVRPHFIVVFLKTLNTLLLPVYIGFAAILLARRLPAAAASPPLDRQAIALFAGVLVITITPYCFLTYLDQLPSRQTYLPSVGLAGVAGILAVKLLDMLKGRCVPLVAGTLLIAILNIGHVWLKDAKFVQRARPTAVLLDTLREPGAWEQSRVFLIADSAYSRLVAQTIVEVFFDNRRRLVFVTAAGRDAAGLHDYLLLWDERKPDMKVLHRPITTPPAPQ